MNIQYDVEVGYDRAVNILLDLDFQIFNKKSGFTDINYLFVLDVWLDSVLDGSFFSLSFKICDVACFF